MAIASPQLPKSDQNPSTPPDKGRFLILSVKAGLGRQGGKVDKEDFLRTIVFLLPREYDFVRVSSLVHCPSLSPKSCHHDNVK
ncbi:MAG: hypothetical protein ACKPA7_09690, partial [Sphaerospermopsis kisseleviana]